MIQFENDELICCINPDFLNLPDYVPKIKDESSFPVPRKCGRLDLLRVLNLEREKNQVQQKLSRSTKN
jgi:hypothetical protein